MRGSCVVHGLFMAGSWMVHGWFVVGSFVIHCAFVLFAIGLRRFVVGSTLIDMFVRLWFAAGSHFH